jgi:hypothetical protein
LRAAVDAAVKCVALVEELAKGQRRGRRLAQIWLEHGEHWNLVKGKGRIVRLPRVPAEGGLLRRTVLEHGRIWRRYGVNPVEETFLDAEDKIAAVDAECTAAAKTFKEPGPIQIERMRHPLLDTWRHVIRVRAWYENVTDRGRRLAKLHKDVADPEAVRTWLEHFAERVRARRYARTQSGGRYPVSSWPVSLQNLWRALPEDGTKIATWQIKKGGGSEPSRTMYEHKSGRWDEVIAECIGHERGFWRRKSNPT